MQDLTGWIMKDHGVEQSKLTVMELSSRSTTKRRYWICQCECRNITIVREDSLKSGRIKSCGMCGNTYEDHGDYLIGIDFNGKTFTVSKEDYEKIRPHKWLVYDSGYVKARISKKCVYLHRFLMDCPKGMTVDHINHDKSDNRRDNLRICTQRENSLNRDCEGVRFDKRRGTWQAYVYTETGFKSLGSFKNKEDAVVARRNGEKLYYKEFSYDCKNQEIN